jgi:hypothetical protein
MKIKAFLHYHKRDWSDEVSYRLHWDDCTEILAPDYVLISEQEFEVEIPDDFDPRPLQIKGLRAVKEKIIAEAHAKVINLEEQIQKLLAIEYKREPEPTT